MAKVQYMVEKKPNQEWSGNIFYRVVTEQDTKQTIIRVEDIAIMDANGSAGFTTFNFNDPYAAQYIPKHRRLLGCYMGLLHSHHHMYGVGPSGTDNNTMEKEGKAVDTNNFLSIIVYNDREKSGGYSVRITQKWNTTPFAGKKVVNNFGKEEEEGDANVTFEKYEDMEIVEVKDVVYEEPYMTEAQEKEIKERVEALDKAEEERKKSPYKFYSSTTNPNTSSNLSYFQKEHSNNKGNKKESSYYYNNYDGYDYNDYDYFDYSHNYDYLRDKDPMQVAMMIANLSVLIENKEYTQDDVNKSFSTLFERAKANFSKFDFDIYVSNFLDSMFDAIFTGLYGNDKLFKKILRIISIAYSENKNSFTQSLWKSLVEYGEDQEYITTKLIKSNGKI